MRQILKLVGIAFIIFALTGCQAMTGRTAGQTVDDATITTSVKGRLAKEKLSSLTRIDVDTRRGTVYLNGVVETPEEKERAQKLASEAGGVVDVVNNLQLQKR